MTLLKDRLFVKLIFLSFIFIKINSFVNSQSVLLPNHLMIPMNRLHYDYDKIIKSNQSEMKNPQLQIKYNNHLIFNSGHPNIDNYAEIYSQGKITSYNSFRLSFSGKWVMIEIEPYQIINKTHYPSDIKNIEVYDFNINIDI